MSKNVSKIAMVITFIGDFPDYFDYFIRSCEFNDNIDFLFFCDKYTGYENKSNNIKFFSITIDEFNALASEKLGVSVTMVNGYKLCDLKPMYGKIYEDYLKQYDFWGFCDIDMILGNLSTVITDEKLRSFDVISSHNQYLSGPFSLFRNTEAINTIYKKSKDWMRVVKTEKRYMGFDEASNVMPHLWEGHNIFNYSSEVESMTHILMNKEKCNINVIFDDFIKERVQKCLTWTNGILTDENGDEVALFHYIVYKTKLNFSVPKLDSRNSFKFDKNGFYINTMTGRTIDRVMGCKNSYIRMAKKVRHKLLKNLLKASQ